MLVNCKNSQKKDDYKYIYDQKFFLNKTNVDNGWIYCGESKDMPQIEELSLKEQAKVSAFFI